MRRVDSLEGAVARWISKHRQETKSIARKEFRYEHSRMAGLIFESGKVALEAFGASAIWQRLTA
jgi:hypothetical protein